jgi:hypothetical protein
MNVKFMCFYYFDFNEQISHQNFAHLL